MAYLAGERMTAGRTNRLQPVDYDAAATSALPVATTTYADIPGCSITFTTAVAGATYKAWGTFDCNVTTTSGSILMVGHLLVDGVVDTGIAVYGMDTLDRATIAMTWKGTLAAAGSHTLKLQGALTSALASGGSFLQSDTKLMLTITEVV
ncbi:hypothetical protein [Streptomyces soliscabiei]|uniref:hypothetical protein n=1 Tax=Streptomyces soliscabiei TaxID=588897 RepID=UPI0029A26961|nr:hypothetical protein [Streptomyces sp. NY05-11A]MDX2679300.1 hypothetical protein [Streptomyces sp. NY05-11A]